MPTHLRSKAVQIAIAVILSLAIAGSSPVALAAAGETSAADPAAGNAPNRNTSDPAKDPAVVPDPVASELRELKEAVEEQTKQFNEHSAELEAERAALRNELDTIAKLETKLGVTPDTILGAATPAAEAVTSDPPAAQNIQTQTPQDWSNRIANLENRVKTFGPFTFSGDLRLREEPFFGGPNTESLDQARARYRLRFNIDAKLNEDFAGGLSLASGDINDPISTNQTITGFYTRKTVAIDKAFIDYSPHELHVLTLIGGKFGYPWYNTELTWDKDLNPEGAAETLAFNLNSTPVLKKIAFVGFQLPFSQVTRGVSSPNNQSLVTSAVYGGQLQTSWELTSWLKFGAYSGFYDYHNADPIALAIARASAKNPQTPLTGLLPLADTNGVTNSEVTTTATNVVTVAGTSYPTGVVNITNAQFNSKFGLFDSLARFDITTPSERWPIAIIGDYVQNTEACANVHDILPAPPNTSSIHYSQSTNVPCVAHQRRGYWSEAQVGRAQQRHDWQFDYAWIFVEREAVLSNFNYSEMRQGTNVTEHRGMVIYQVLPNVQTSFTALIGRPLTNSTAPPQNWLTRLQFDVIYSF